MSQAAVRTHPRRAARPGRGSLRRSDRCGLREGARGSHACPAAPPSASEPARRAGSGRVRPRASRGRPAPPPASGKRRPPPAPPARPAPPPLAVRLPPGQGQRQEGPRPCHHAQVAPAAPPLPPVVDSPVAAKARSGGPPCTEPMRRHRGAATWLPAVKAMSPLVSLEQETQADLGTLCEKLRSGVETRAFLTPPTFCTLYRDGAQLAFWGLEGAASCVPMVGPPAFCSLLHPR